MGGETPNYTFSVRKDRELSSIEGKVNSIKRRFSNSRKGTKFWRQEIEINRNSPSKFVSKMPKYGNKHLEQGNCDGDNDKGKSREPCSTYDGSRAHRRSDRDTEFQLSPDLGPFKDAVRMTVKHMSETREAIKNLSDLYEKHVQDIEMIATIQRKFIAMEKESQEKDEKIRRQNDGLLALAEAARGKENKLREEEDAIARDRRLLEEERQSLQKSKDNADKRNKLREAEMRHEQEEERKMLKAKQEKEFTQKMEELEREKSRLGDEHRMKLGNLDVEMTKLSGELEVLKKEKKETEENLARAEAKHEDLGRVKDSFKQEAKELKTRLKAMENEFGLGTQEVQFYKDKFAEISKEVEELSARYFTDLSGNDFGFIHNELARTDGHFASVPISESEDSEALRVAHVQRVICGFLCEKIWRPFSSELTLQQPEFETYLCAISKAVATSTSSANASGRAEITWAALTMRALQSSSISQANSASSRVETVISDVSSVLKSLINPAQETQLHHDLGKLISSAVSLWNSAQTDELQITVWPNLSLTDLSEWRSLNLDPPKPFLEDGKATSTHPRIFTLFPRITARKVLLTVEATTGPPGSWPESEREASAEEICIHNGIGLRECSALVIRGKKEEEDRQAEEAQKKKHLQEVIDKEEKEWNAKSRRAGRRRSLVSSASGPQSPIAQWRIDGGSRVLEE